MANVIIPNVLTHYPHWLGWTASSIQSTLMAEVGPLLTITKGQGAGRQMARFGATYTYFGRPLPTYPIGPCLAALQLLVQNVTKMSFNAAVVNLYVDGMAKLPPHSDTRAIPQLGKAPTIAGVSLGAVRPFVFQNLKKGAGHITHNISLGHGDLYTMTGVSQSHWRHGMPAHPMCVTPRVSITFR